MIASPHKGDGSGDHPAPITAAVNGSKEKIMKLRSPAAVALVVLTTSAVSAQTKHLKMTHQQMMQHSAMMHHTTAKP